MLLSVHKTRMGETRCSTTRTDVRRVESQESDARSRNYLRRWRAASSAPSTPTNTDTYTYRKSIDERRHPTAPLTRVRWTTAERAASRALYPLFNCPRFSRESHRRDGVDGRPQATTQKPTDRGCSMISCRSEGERVGL